MTAPAIAKVVSAQAAPFVGPSVVSLNATPSSRTQNGGFVANYTIEALSGAGIVRLMAPLTAADAYSKVVQLRKQGFTNITAVNVTSGRKITQVERLLKDLES